MCSWWLIPVKLLAVSKDVQDFILALLALDLDKIIVYSLKYNKGSTVSYQLSVEGGWINVSKQLHQMI